MSTEDTDTVSVPRASLETLARAARLVEATPIGLVVYRLVQPEPPDFVLETCNPAAARLLGQWAGQRMRAALAAEPAAVPDVDNTMARWHEVLRGGLDVVDEVAFRGEWYRVHRTPLDAERLLLSFENVHERREATLSLHEERAELEATVRARTTELETTRRQLYQAQRMEALGRLAGGIAHDFNNMLSVILSATGLASRRSDRESVKRDLAQISQAALRAAELSRQLLAFSRRQVLEPRHVSLDEIVRHTEPMLRRLLGEDIRIVTSLATGAERVLVDPGKMEQVLVNLAVNARDAMPAGGTLQIATRRVTLAAGEARELGGATAGEWLVLAVADEGVGIDPETQAHIFEPFFTTKPDGRGTGLGLSTVFGIVSQSGGYITVDSEPGRGACFSIYLPPTEDPVDFETSEPAPESAGGSEIVLVVEDDPLVRRAALRVLQSKGYAVLDAASAEEALALLGDHEGPVDLLLTDLVLPGMNGLDLARQLLRERPALKVVCMTGYVGRDFGSGVPAEEDIEFINKPFDHEGLANKVRSVLDR